ncbi:MAG: hypothetical protein EAZ61_04230, partial [Oscillatoriales cyanobacterium]
MTLLLTLIPQPHFDQLSASLLPFWEKGSQILRIKSPSPALGYRVYTSVQITHLGQFEAQSLATLMPPNLEKS